MEFEVTATRKRPKTLGEMVGQEFVVATLSNALNNDQLAHAYLFSGPRGTGKTSTARILARSLNCENGPTAEPCGTCASCAEINKGSSPDVIEIDGASNTSVNDVREIKDEVLYAPQSSRKKIYIIDEVHMLSNSAFNALLKTIEEPPPYIVFIFATTEVHKVPATIRSRCQQFRFRLFSPELIRDKLVEAAGEMGRDFETDALYWIAREAGGSMRDAYTLFDQVMSFSEEKITLSGIREKMGLVGLESTSELLDAAAAGNRKRALEILDDVLQSGTAVEQFLVELADFLRNLVLLSYGIDKESLLGLSVDRFPAGPRNAWDSRKLESAAEDAFSLFRDIRYSMNPRYELELFIGRLCSLTDRVESQDVLQRISALRRELLTGEWTAVETTAEDTKKKIPESGLNPVPEQIESGSSGSPDSRSPSVNPGEEEQAERFFASFRKGASRPSAFPSQAETGEPECAVPVDIGTGGRPEPESRPAEVDFADSGGEVFPTPAVPDSQPGTITAESPASTARVVPEQPAPTTESFGVSLDAADDAMPPLQEDAPDGIEPSGRMIPQADEEFDSSAHDAIPPVRDPAEMKDKLVDQLKRGNLTLASALDKALDWEWGEDRLVLTFASNYESALVSNETETLRQASINAGLGSFAVETRTRTVDSESETAESSRVLLVKQVFRGQVMKG